MPGARRQQALLGLRGRGREADPVARARGCRRTPNATSSPAATSDTSAPSCRPRSVVSPRSTTPSRRPSTTPSPPRRRTRPRSPRPWPRCGSAPSPRLCARKACAASSTSAAVRAPCFARLIDDPTFLEILGVDVSHRALEIAARRLNFDRMPDSKRARIELLQSSATYRDDRLSGKDAVVLMEVIEHVDDPRLPALVRSVFVHARPTSVVVTTPNVEHNVRYEFLAAGAMRHRDHRFEWTRAQFRAWADEVAGAHGYARAVPARWARTTPRSDRRRRWRSSGGRRERARRSRSCPWSAWSVRAGPASRPSPPRTSAASRSSPATSAVAWSATTRTTRPRATRRSRCCTTSRASASMRAS